MEISLHEEQAFKAHWQDTMLKRAAILDDDQVFRTGLGQVLQEQFGISVGFSGDFLALPRLVDSQPAMDLYVINPSRQQTQNYEWISALGSLTGAGKIVTMIDATDAPITASFFDAPINAYLLKPVPLLAITQLFESLDGLDRDQKFLSEEHNKLFAASEQLGESTSDLQGRKLSAREHRVLVCTANGQSSAQIARDLGISTKTAERHRRSIFTKLNLNNVVELTKYAVREGLTNI